MNRTVAPALIDAKSWHRRASPLARAALLAYVVLIVYAGLAPWSGWRDLGVSAWAFIDAPMPRHITTFDLVVNVLGYLPFGALMVLALHPRIRAARAFVVTVLAGAALAGSIEALQTFLPRRVASNIDLTTNLTGTVLGALLALPLAGSLIDRGRLAQLRARWFLRESSVLLVLLALWPAAQLAPASMLFGNGALHGVAPIELTAGFDAADFVLAEALVVVAATLAAGLSLASVMQAGAPRGLLLLAFIGMALLARSFAYATAFGPERAFVWLTPGAIGGLCLGVLALLVAAQGRPRAVYGAAWLAALVWLVAVNVLPENPYNAHWLAQFRPGRLAHFHSVAQWLAEAWPWLLLIGLAALPWVRRNGLMRPG